MGPTGPLGVSIVRVELVEGLDSAGDVSVASWTGYRRLEYTG